MTLSDVWRIGSGIIQAAVQHFIPNAAWLGVAECEDGSINLDFRPPNVLSSQHIGINRYSLTHQQMNAYLKWTLRCLLALCVMLLIWLTALIALIPILESTKLCEAHTFPGTSHPEIQIRCSGFLDASFSAYTKVFLWNHELVSLPSGRPALCRSNPTPRTRQGDVKADRAWGPRYDVIWSSDGKRVGFAMGSWFVAACDLKTGKTIEFQNCPTAKTKEDAFVESVLEDSFIDSFLNGGQAAGAYSSQAR